MSAPESHSGGENWSGEALRVRGVSWWKDGAAAAAAVGLVDVGGGGGGEDDLSETWKTSWFESSDAERLS